MSGLLGNFTELFMPDEPKAETRDENGEVVPNAMERALQQALDDLAAQKAAEEQPQTAQESEPRKGFAAAPRGPSSFGRRNFS